MAENELTPEQVEALQGQMVELQEKMKGMVPSDELVKLKTEYDGKVQDLEKQVNPNWQKTRQNLDALIKIAKDKGVEVDAEGNVVNNPNNVDIENIRQEAARSGHDAALKTLVNSKLEDLLGQYDDESAKLVKRSWEKLTTGEEVNLQNVKKFFEQAEGAASASASSELKTGKLGKFASYAGGQGPRQATEDNKNDEVANELAGLMGIKIKGDEQK